MMGGKKSRGSGVEVASEGEVAALSQAMAQEQGAVEEQQVEEDADLAALLGVAPAPPAASVRTRTVQFSMGPESEGEGEEEGEEGGGRASGGRDIFRKRSRVKQQQQQEQQEQQQQQEEQPEQETACLPVLPASVRHYIEESERVAEHSVVALPDLAAREVASLLQRAGEKRQRRGEGQQQRALTAHPMAALSMDGATALSELWSRGASAALAARAERAVAATQQQEQEEQELQEVEPDGEEADGEEEADEELLCCEI